MCELPDVVRIIADTYDAALQPALWEGVLARIATFVQGHVSGLLVKDPIRKFVEAHCHAGGDPHYMQLYAETYSQLGPVATSRFSDADQVVSIPELVDYQEFCRGRFYQEWAHPQGWVDVGVAVLEQSSAGYAYLSISRHRAHGMVDDEMRARMRLVVPHVRRAVLIGRTIGFKQEEAAAFGRTIDALSAAVFLLDAGGRIMHANTAGHELLDASNVLRATGHRLVAVNAQTEQVLNAAVAAAARGDTAAGASGIALALITRDGARYLGHVLPLRSGLRAQSEHMHGASIALFVRRVGMELPPSELVGQTYKLTAAELRVLFGIVKVGGVPDVAARLGVAETTIKTHLGRVFEKTGTNRQADLVKLVAGFASPVIAATNSAYSLPRVAAPAGVGVGDDQGRLAGGHLLPPALVQQQ
ncbi:MAG: helix-turn-helix transcriptional regulator [Xanthobacteraceae bacterium]|nr:helix-turn-helix transcriptional regulator [Xanthobacteraceae bacterium]